MKPSNHSCSLAMADPISICQTKERQSLASIIIDSRVSASIRTGNILKDLVKDDCNGVGGGASLALHPTHNVVPASTATYPSLAT